MLRKNYIEQPTISEIGKRIRSAETGLPLGKKPSSIGKFINRWKKAVGISILGTTLIGGTYIGDTYCLNKFYELPNGMPEKEYVLTLTEEREDKMYSVQPNPFTLTENIPNFTFEGRKQHNSLGYRNGDQEFSLKKPEGQIRIEAIGGSTTHEFPFVMDPKDTWIMQLGEMLRAHYQLSENQLLAINGGMSGASTNSLLGRYTLQDQFLGLDIIIASMGVNDKYALYMTKTGKKSGIEYIIADDYESDYTHYLSQKVLAKPGKIEEWLLRRSGAFRLFYIWNISERGFEFYPRDTKTGEYNSEEALARVENLLKRPQELGITKNLNTLIKLARENETEVVIAPEPQIHIPLSGDNAFTRYKREMWKVESRALEGQREIMKSLVQQNDGPNKGVHYVEISPNSSIPEDKDPKTGEQRHLRDHLYDGIHPSSREGERIIATILFKYMLQNEIIEKIAERRNLRLTKSPSVTRTSPDEKPFQQESKLKQTASNN